MQTQYLYLGVFPNLYQCKITFDEILPLQDYHSGISYDSFLFTVLIFLQTRLYIDNIRSNAGRSYFGLPHRNLDPIYTPMK